MIEIINSQQSNLLGIDFNDKSDEIYAASPFELTNSNIIDWGKSGFLKFKYRFLQDKEINHAQQIQNTSNLMNQNFNRSESEHLLSLDYSYEFSERMALNYAFSFSSASVSKSAFFDGNYLSNLQQSIFGKQASVKNDIKLLGKFQALKWEVIPYIHQYSKEINVSKIPQNARNEFVGLKTKLNIGYKSLEWDSSIDLVKALFKLDEETAYSSSKLLYDFNLLIKPNTIHEMKLFSSQTWKIMGLDQMLFVPIFTSARTQTQYEKNISPENTKSLGVSYAYNDPIQFLTFHGSIIRDWKTNSFQTTILSNSNYIQTIFFRSPQEIQSTIGALSFNYLIPFLQCSVLSNANWIQNESINFIDRSLQRNIKNNSANYNIMFKTGFTLPVGLEYTFDFSQNTNLVNQKLQATMNFWTHKWHFYGFIGKNTSFLADYILINPNASENNTLNIFNIELKYKLKKEGGELILKGQKLGNLTYYKQQSITDYAQSSSSIRLLGVSYLISYQITF